MNEDIHTWEQWESDRERHLNRFQGRGCAQLTGIFGFVALLGTLVGCAAMFGMVGEGGALQGLGGIALSWLPLLAWVGLTTLYRMMIEKREEKKQLDALLNDPSPSKRCNAAYRLSVINAKEAMPHLKSLLSDDAIDPQLREYAEESLAKLEEEETQES